MSRTLRVDCYHERFLSQNWLLIHDIRRHLNAFELSPHREFFQDAFYRLLDETESAVREQMRIGGSDGGGGSGGGGGSATTRDLPRYIVEKLGLNKSLITDRGADGSTTGDASPPLTQPPLGDGGDVKEEALLSALTADAPREADYETIRLISNGAYGAVYLVRQRRTRQRFALKKMKKSTLLLRNQIDQVFAERDM